MYIKNPKKSRKGVNSMAKKRHRIRGKNKKPQQEQKNNQNKNTQSKGQNKRSEDVQKKSELKNSNIQYQLTEAIKHAFRPGSDKHSDKKNKATSDKIYSHGANRSIKSTACQFARYLKENNIDKAKKIEERHYQAFLNEKAKTVNDTTLSKMKSHLKKLDNCLNSFYKSYQKCAQNIVQPAALNNTKCRSMAMTREDLSKVKAECKQDCASKLGIEIASRIGQRAESICKLKGTDYDPDRGTLKIINAKGSRSWEIEIKEKDKKFFEELREKCGEERMVPVHHESMQEYMRTKLRAAGLERYIEEKTSFHSIRKMVAQELYDEKKEQGMDWKSAWNEVSDYLGHGDDRWKLFQTYILNP